MDDYVAKPISREDLMNATARNMVPTNVPAQSAADNVFKSQIAGNNSENGSSRELPIESWINQEKFLERVGGDQELLVSMAGMFPDEVQKCLSALEAARSAKNASDVQINAHTLKGICNMFDATMAASAALALEVTAQDGALGSEAQVNILRAELDRAMLAVRQLQAALNQH